MDAAQKKNTQQRTGTVLLVDDESGVRKYMRKVLESHGYRVLDAGDGDDAMELARRHGGPIDLLLTDDVLPGMQGTEVIRRFRKLRPGVPAVRMSGYPEHFGGYRDEGVGYLEKPFSPQGLLGRVREVLEANLAAGLNPEISEAASV
jgi:two-component system, cell cycle sensor histidine kinase and response regulator CckA